MRIRTLDLDANGFLHDPAHAAMLLRRKTCSVLRQATFQVDCFPDVNQLVVRVVNEVDAGRTGKRLQEFRAEFPVEISCCHSRW